MESVGIEFPCNRLKVPYAIFKIPFDSVSENSLKVDKKDIISSLGNINF
jgi:nucleoside phosphorylase